MLCVVKSASLLRCFPSYLSGKRKGRPLSVLFKHDNIPKRLTLIHISLGYTRSLWTLSNSDWAAKNQPGSLLARRHLHSRLARHGRGS
jgi:hypothetical protein